MSASLAQTPRSERGNSATGPEYRDWLRVKAVSSDAAFAEYVSDLAFPFHLREAERFVNQHGSALVLEPRGHAKTTLFIHRVARLVGATEGRVRIIVLTSVQEDAEDRSKAVRDLVETSRFAEVFPWAHRGVRGREWNDKSWTIGGNEAMLGKDSTCRALGLLSARAGPRADIMLADDMVRM